MQGGRLGPKGSTQNHKGGLCCNLFEPTECKTFNAFNQIHVRQTKVLHVHPLPKTDLTSRDMNASLVAKKDVDRVVSMDLHHLRMHLHEDIVIEARRAFVSHIADKEQDNSSETARD